jgi:preprotein translocase subunit SecA|uniref:Protein translocase subunit SecA n=1 Tax=Thorea hispida TaxID=202687 RepID=A0A1Z1XAQ5_9FLOR|nr:preprotein translocase subunit A [Thorea hispida]
MLNFFSNNPFRNLIYYENQVKQINQIAVSMKIWPNNKLKYQTQKLQLEIKKGKNLDKILPEAFATIKETCRRLLNINLFDVQLIGGIILHQGKIAEMKTGEGKTIVAILPIYLNALSEKGTHIITVNDYLAKRDFEWTGQIYTFLGLTIGLIQQNMPILERQINYNKHITYVTNSELGFDYLRDNMAINAKNLVQRGFHFCVIDEVDSILIDEARTPLIISGPSAIPTDKYLIANSLSQKLQKNLHYEVDEKSKNIILTDSGTIYSENYLKISNIYQIHNSWAQYVLNALKAKELFCKNQHYIVKQKEVIIVDEFTGRIMPGRRWSDGLHQAIEAKENIPIQQENQTLASITYQNLFLLYDKLSGMSGTAQTESKEFEQIYKIQVIQIPTNQPCIRKDLPDIIYQKEYDKWIAIANECFHMYQIGRPTLIGTTNIEKSELLAQILDKYKLPYNLLNAKPENISKESEIIAQAGKSHTVTIATNMAGRGTDIILGGNMKYMVKCIIKKSLIQYFNLKNFNNLHEINTIENLENNVKSVLLKLYIKLNKQSNISKLTRSSLEQYIETCFLANDLNNEEDKLSIKEAYENILALYKQKFIEDKKKVIAAGGLHVIGTERHEARRIDNQLRGRAGRQGDPGSSRFFLSLEDNLMRIFGGEKISNLMKTLKINESTPIESKLLNKSLDSAQKKVESYYYNIRRQLFEYDEVLNHQRKAIYTERQKILHTSYARDYILQYGESTIIEIIRFYKNQGFKICIKKKLATLLNLPYEIEMVLQKINSEQIQKFFCTQLYITYDLREAYLEQLRPGLIRQLEKYYLLQQIDKAWQEHLENMTNLRETIGWRSYGQQDPLIEYKNEAFLLFINMVTYIRETVIYLVMRSKLVIDSNLLTKN